MTEVIVTGAEGFIGQVLVRRLRHQGRQVLALARRDGDIEETVTWATLPQAEAVVHLAGRSYVPDSWTDGVGFIRTNVVGTEQAIAYCRRVGARLVYVSAYVYGIPKRLPIGEGHPVNPSNPYALSKYLAEQLCQFAGRYHGVPVTVLRLFNVFGPGQRPEFLIPSIIDQVRRGREIRVMDLKPRRDYVHVDDVAEAIIKALNLATGGAVVNIGSGESFSVADIIVLVQAIAGTNLPVISKAEERPQEIPDVRADISAAEQVLHWKPQLSFADGLQKMLRLE